MNKRETGSAKTKQTKNKQTKEQNNNNNNNNKTKQTKKWSYICAKLSAPTDYELEGRVSNILWQEQILTEDKDTNKGLNGQRLCPVWGTVRVSHPVWRKMANVEIVIQSPTSLLGQSSNTCQGPLV